MREVVGYSEEECKASVSDQRTHEIGDPLPVGWSGAKPPINNLKSEALNFGRETLVSEVAEDDDNGARLAEGDGSVASATKVHLLDRSA